jgi:hypothetical protein
MKIQVISDLHMEFRAPPLIENLGSTVLLLGGDIAVAEHIYRHPRGPLPNNAENAHKAQCYRDFWQHVNHNWAQVIYVAGNHEHYHGRWDRTIDLLKQEMQHYPNIAVCDQDRVVVEDVTFLGVSLWTDFNNRDPLTLQVAHTAMHDFRVITEPQQTLDPLCSSHSLRPQTALAKHYSDVQWLSRELSAHTGKTVVVSHHCHSFSSIAPQYRGPQHQLMNGAFASNLDDLILDHPQIALWTHGHTHSCFDYHIGQTRIVCNPYGYPGEINSFDPGLIIEV